MDYKQGQVSSNGNPEREYLQPGNFIEDVSLNQILKMNKGKVIPGKGMNMKKSTEVGNHYVFC